MMLRSPSRVRGRPSTRYPSSVSRFGLHRRRDDRSRSPPTARELSYRTRSPQNNHHQSVHSRDEIFSEHRLSRSISHVFSLNSRYQGMQAIDESFSERRLARPRSHSPFLNSHRQGVQAVDGTLSEPRLARPRSQNSMNSHDNVQSTNERFQNLLSLTHTERDGRLVGDTSWGLPNDESEETNPGEADIATSSKTTKDFGDGEHHFWSKQT